VHFDPVVPEHQPAQNPRLVDALIDTGREDEESAPPPRAREGLPPAFRMRHARHYVEQVMGDAPIRTVREIALHDIEPGTPSDVVDLQPLESSIRAIGVLEPLLVRPDGRRFLVISGVKRLLAARAAGLRTVPCLVHDVDDDMAGRIRAAVDVRPGPALRVADPEASAGSGASADPAMEFVEALAPAIQACAGDPLRRSVLGDLAAAELARTRLSAACAAAASEHGALQRTAFEIGGLLPEVVDAVRPEARLRGVRLEIAGPPAPFELTADLKSVAAAATAVVHAALALVPHGFAVHVDMLGTVIRPAMVLHVRLPFAEIDGATAARLFDADLKPHPCGVSAGVMMSAARRIARLHGGRADAHVDPSGALTLTLVIPEPISAS
jgi:hypothetical protein